jgi:superfamily II DNA or RNA helicase
MITPRPYQTPAIEALANADLGYIVSKAGSGKTIIAACAIRAREIAAMHPMRWLWLAYTRELLTQGEDACRAAGILSHVDFACVQGLTAIPPDVDGVIIDEVHHVAAPESKRIMRSTLSRKPDGSWARRCIVWGLTATPDREDGEPIEPVIGPCLYTVPEDAIKAAGGVLPGRVQIVRYHDAAVKEAAQDAAGKEIRSWMSDEQVSRVVYRHVLRIGVTENEGRNRFVAGIIRQHILAGAAVIALADTIEQCTAIADMAGLGASAFHARLGKRERERVLAEFKAGILKCIVATSVADEGMDCPIANVLIMARASKAAGRTEQRAGRVMRPYPGKAYGLVVDVFDTSHGMLAGQHHKRKRLYSEWGFSIEKGL